MKRKIILIVLIVLAVGGIILGLVLFNHSLELENSKLKIYDATYPPCSSTSSKFYEDSEYEYYFTCSKIDSVFVKFSNGNKMLLIDALNENKVTIDEIIDAWQDVRIVRK